MWVRTGWGQGHPISHTQWFDISISARLTCLWQADDALERPAHREAIKRLLFSAALAQDGRAPLARGVPPSELHVDFPDSPKGSLFHLKV